MNIFYDLKLLNIQNHCSPLYATNARTFAAKLIQENFHPTSNLYQRFDTCFNHRVKKAINLPRLLGELTMNLNII